MSTTESGQRNTGELSLKEELRALLNRHSQEQASNTPDFILAESMLQYLSILETTIKLRDNWYGIKPDPLNPHGRVEQSAGGDGEVSEPPAFSA